MTPLLGLNVDGATCLLSFMSRSLLLFRLCEIGALERCSDVTVESDFLLKSQIIENDNNHIRISVNNLTLQLELYALFSLPFQCSSKL